MDAAEHDADVKLYKSSGELLSEIQWKLPLITRTPSGTRRKWVLSGKVEEVADLLGRFQEWPQLLDPHLTHLTQELVDSYLSYCVSNSSAYLRKHDYTAYFIPLPRAIARLLYSLCKVRGQKIIVRLLNNEPKYVETLVTCFRLWGYDESAAGAHSSVFMNWEERYIMLLWLSHLMLAPFELSSISVLAAEFQHDNVMHLGESLPAVAKNLLSLALNHINVSSKAREAASILAVRLALRGDMQALGLPKTLVNWSISQLNAEVTMGMESTYHHIGLLSLLFGMVNSASDSDSMMFLAPLSAAVHQIASSEQDQDTRIRDQAPARKLLVKIMRAIILHAISALRSNNSQDSVLDIDSLLEETIQVLLDYLGDKDTPVRQASSKALSLIALNLDPAMSAEIVEAVLANLNENMLLENIRTGQLLPVTDMIAEEAVGYKKNVNAVDPLKWHGAMLTLGHLLFRRSPPVGQLVPIIEALVMGLEFEQRSNVGTSIGVGVRDAACFGLWSLARKYSTTELKDVRIADSFHLRSDITMKAADIHSIQLIATRLVVSACLDPSGNLRRGSSAALQELIGRHPDVVAQGIPVVQIVDYHAVARRSRAMDDVALSASDLDYTYQDALQYAFLQWRGSRSTDAESRRCAAHSIGTLFASMQPVIRLSYLHNLISQIRSLRSSNVGSNAAARHGLVLGLARVLKVSLEICNAAELLPIAEVILPLLQELSLVTGSVTGRVTVDIELVFEAIADFIAAASRLIFTAQGIEDLAHTSAGKISWLAGAMAVLDRCTILSENDIVSEAAAKANLAVLSILPNVPTSVESWLDSTAQKQSDYTSKGRIASLGALLRMLSEEKDLTRMRKAQNLKANIVSYFCELVQSARFSIETKDNAMQSIKLALSAPIVLDDSQLKQLASAIITGLADYTVDQRGDIGSNLRLASIDAVQSLVRHTVDMGQLMNILQLVAKLAAERLAKLRFKAWRCLETLTTVDQLHEVIFPAGSTTPVQQPSGIEHQADVSSRKYYKALLKYLDLNDLHDSLVVGLVSSVAAGTEDISRASTEAIVSMMLERDEQYRQPVFQSMLTCIVQHLANTAEGDDRNVVSAVDFLTFLLEELLATLPPAEQSVADTQTLWSVVQKVHGTASSLLRLEALIRLYSAILAVDALQAMALERMSRMLLHKWPKIRTTAAAYIYMYAKPASIVNVNWHAPVASNKAAVVELRKALNVSGATAKASS